jgi:hypothetical protein
MCQARKWLILQAGKKIFLLNVNLIDRQEMPGSQGPRRRALFASVLSTTSALAQGGEGVGILRRWMSDWLTASRNT